MSILRPISIFLRNFLIKQHPYFSCCASCGEIQTPLGTRLCTSLTPSFSIDAVIIPDSSSSDTSHSIQAIRNLFPWLRNIVILSGQKKENDSPNTFWITLDHIKTLLAGCEMPSESLPCPEAYFHLLPELGENYLVFTESYSPVQTSPDPLDFYTPNGLPLLPVSLIAHLPKGAALQKNRNELFLQYLLDSSEQISPPSAYSHTKADAAQFLEFFEQYLQLAEASGAPGKPYGLVVSQWLYITGRGIAVPHTFFS